MPVVGRLDQYASMLCQEFDDYSMSENLFLYSEQFNQSSWTNEGSFETAETTGTLSPDGFNTAEKLIGNNGQANRQSIYQNISCTSGTTYTFSVFLKQAERRYATIWFDTASITEGAFYGSSTYIDLQTGTTANLTQTRIVAYPNGWYRCYVTATPSFTGSLRLNLSIGTPNNAADGAGTIAYQYTGDGVSGIYIWGAQIERGTLTDYTPTTTTAISRVLASTTNTNITGLGTYYSSGFDENVGFTTFLPANVFPPYDLVYDEFSGTSFGAGQGRYMRQNTDKSVIVYNEIDEVTDFYGRGIVRDGLVLDLDAGKTDSYSGSGTIWTDLSPNGNNGTLTNGPTYSSANGGSLVFDGTNDFVNLGTSYSTLQPQTATLGVWYKQSLNVTFYGICGWSFYGFGGGFLIDSSANNPFINIGNGSWSSQLSSNITLSTSLYAYVVGTYDGASLKIYVNGVLANSQNLVTTIGYSSKGFAVGGYYGSTSNSFPGNISMAQMYNRALTQTEISQNYNALRGRYGL